MGPAAVRDCCLISLSPPLPTSAFWPESSTFVTSHPADEPRFHKMADAKTPLSCKLLHLRLSQAFSLFSFPFPCPSLSCSLSLSLALSPSLLAPLTPSVYHCSSMRYLEKVAARTLVFGLYICREPGQVPFIACHGGFRVRSDEMRQGPLHRARWA